MILTCTGCKVPVSSTWTYCPYCGAQGRDGERMPTERDDPTKNPEIARAMAAYHLGAAYAVDGETRGLGRTNQIKTFFHCAGCLKKMPPGLSPRDWVRLEAGFTKLGIQIWCVRCNKNVCNIDFNGMKHPAETRA